MAQTLTGRGAPTHLRPSRLRTWWMLVALLCAAPSLVRAQRFALPVDLEQGLVIGAAEPRTPYLFGLRIVPSLDVERARFGVVLGPMYRNPSWDFTAGANMALFVPTSGKETGFRFTLQGEYLLHQQAGRISFGIAAELLGLLRIGLWPAYDFAARRPELCLTVGADVMSWVKVLRDEW